MLIPRRSARFTRRARFAKVVGVLTNKGGSFVLVLGNNELASPRRFHRATTRIIGLNLGMAVKSETVLIEGVLDVLKTWWETDYTTVSRPIANVFQPMLGKSYSYDVVGSVDYLGWRLTLVDTGDPETQQNLNVERGVRMEVQPRTQKRGH